MSGMDQGYPVYEEWPPEDDNEPEESSMSKVHRLLELSYILETIKSIRAMADKAEERIRILAADIGGESR